MPNDPRPHLPARSGRPLPVAPSCALVSLALWLALLIAIPAWVIGALVAALLVGCAAGALVPRLSTSRAGRADARAERPA